MNKESKYGFLSLLPVLLLMLTAAALLIGYLSIPDIRTSDEDSVEFEYRVAFISEYSDSTFSKALYEGAADRGLEYNIYVEWIGQDLDGSLTEAEALDMAIYEKVDGILLRPNGSEELLTLIDKANRYGIPVITVQKDLSESSRQGFVGSNDYFLGQEYGKRIRELFEDENAKVAVLFSESSFDNTSRSWFSQGVQNAAGGENIRFDFQTIKNQSGLGNAEEVIRELMEKGEDAPDLILCLDEMTTLSVNHLLRDSEYEKKPILIGSDLSVEILEAIQKGELDSTITTDLTEMGSMGLEAWMKYRDFHMVSYYTEVGTRLIDQDQVEAELQKLQDEGIEDAS